MLGYEQQLGRLVLDLSEDERRALLLAYMISEVKYSALSTEYEVTRIYPFC
jgi:hypothetical protein